MNCWVKKHSKNGGNVQKIRLLSTIKGKLFLMPLGLALLPGGAPDKSIAGDRGLSR
jgi:hypothetical protein